MDKRQDTQISMEDFLADLSEQGKAELKDHGLEVDTLDAAIKAFNALGVDEPNYKEQVIGNLTEEELKLYVLVATISDTFDDLRHELSGNAMIATGQALKDKDENPEAIKAKMEANAVEFSELYKCERKLETYKSAMYHSICSRLGFWDWVIGIRSKQRIVITERRW